MLRFLHTDRDTLVLLGVIVSVPEPAQSNFSLIRGLGWTSSSVATLTPFLPTTVPKTTYMVISEVHMCRLD